MANGAAYSGLYGQVVLIQKCISITEVVHGAASSGLYRQVVLIQRCISITEVAHGATSVVTIDRLARWSLLQVVFETAFTAYACYLHDDRAWHFTGYISLILQ